MCAARLGSPGHSPQTLRERLHDASARSRSLLARWLTVRGSEGIGDRHGLALVVDSVDVEDRRVAREVLPESGHAVRDFLGEHLVRDNNRQVLADDGKRRGRPVAAGRPFGRQEHPDVELERRPPPRQAFCRQLAESARRGHAGTSAGEALRCSGSHLQRNPQRIVEMLNDPLDLQEVALDQRGDAVALDGKPAGSGQEDASQLEQPECIGVTAVAPRDVDETGDESGAQRPGVAHQTPRSGLGRAQRDARRVDLEQPASSQRVLDAPMSALLARESRDPRRTSANDSERDPVDLDPRDLLDEVDLAGDMSRSPGRHADAPASIDPEPEPL